MKAIKITVCSGERQYLKSFIEAVNSKDVLAYSINDTSAIVVTEGECSMGYVFAIIERDFVSTNIETIR